MSTYIPFEKVFQAFLNKDGFSRKLELIRKQFNEVVL